MLAGLGAALAVGLLVGVERGWKQRGAAEATRVAGLRTYTLIGLLGGVSGLLGALIGPIAFAALALGFSIMWFGFKLWDVLVDGDPSATGLVAGVCVFALGALASSGAVEPALAAGVALAGVLAFKKGLHAGLQHLSWEELRAALLLLAASLVALPLLPDRAYGPFDMVNPRELWILTIALAGLSFFGHLGVRMFGARRGLTVAGLFGAMVSSTAVTLDAARRSRAGTAPKALAASIAAGANAVMYAPIFGLLAVFGPGALPLAGPPLAAAALVSAGFAAAFQFSRGEMQTDKEAASGPPVDLAFVAQVAVLLAVITALTRVATGVWGESGLVATAAIAGLVDVDAVTLAVAGLAGDAVSATLAGWAALAAVAAATASKAGLGAGFGAPGFAVRHLASSAASLLTGGAALALVSVSDF